MTFKRQPSIIKKVMRREDLDNGPGHLTPVGGPVVGCDRFEFDAEHLGEIASDSCVIHAASQWPQEYLVVGAQAITPLRSLARPSDYPSVTPNGDLIVGVLP